MREKLLTPNDLDGHQVKQIKFALRHNKCAIVADMSMGKTVVGYTLFERRYYSNQAKRCLIVAPPFPARQTWANEHRKWSHLRHLRVNLAIGTPKQRMLAIEAPSNAVILTIDCVEWLAKTYKRKAPFDMIILDESSYVKAHDSNRFHALAYLTSYIPYLLELTGTPIAQNYTSLWPQMYLIDRGEALGENITAFRQKFCVKHPAFYNYKVHEFAKPEIEKRIKPYFLTMKASDYMKLPDRKETIKHVEVTKEQASLDKQILREKLLQLRDAEITLETALAVANIRRQIMTGGIYTEHPKYYEVPTFKHDALEEYFEIGDNFILTYSFIFEREILLSKYKDKLTLMNSKNLEAVSEQWNKGEIQCLLVNPKSAAHGLNLQFGGHRIVWFSPIHSNELTNQLNSRLPRRGQQSPSVYIDYLITENTIEQRIYNTRLGHYKSEREFINAMLS